MRLKRYFHLYFDSVANILCPMKGYLSNKSVRSTRYLTRYSDSTNIKITFKTTNKTARISVEYCQHHRKTFLIISAISCHIFAISFSWLSLSFALSLHALSENRILGSDHACKFSYFLQCWLSPVVALCIEVFPIFCCIFGQLHRSIVSYDENIIFWS